jgi:carboxyl-terminal processing protease
MERKLVLWLTVGLIVLALTLFTQGLFYRPETAVDQPPERERFLDPLWEVYQKAKEHFYRPERMEDEKLLEEAIRGMMKGLDDPYSRFNTKEEFEHFSIELEGQYEGIGAYIGLRDGELTVIAPIKGGPAEREGVRAGDVILEIDGESTQGFTPDDAARRLRGPKGTFVTILVRHLDGSIEEITIVRERIQLVSVEHKLIDPSIAYVRLNSFSRTTPSELRRALEELQEESIEGLILDLRGNGGGLLHVAEQVGSLFVDQGKPLLIERGRFGERVRHSSGNKLPNWPIAVLVDGGTASASEILAGAIRDNEMGVLVGRRTFGKGVIQTPFELKEGGRLILTTAEYLTPAGHQVQDVGLEPQFQVESWYPTLLEVRKELRGLEEILPKFATATRAVLQDLREILNRLEQKATHDEYEAALAALDEFRQRLEMDPKELLREAGVLEDDPESVLIAPLLAELKAQIDPLLDELTRRLERNDIAVAIEWLTSMQDQLCPCELAVPAGSASEP